MDMAEKNHAITEDILIDVDTMNCHITYSAVTDATEMKWDELIRTFCENDLIYYIDLESFRSQIQLGIIISEMEKAIDQTVVACSEMSKSKTGVLIVFERHILLDDMVRSGEWTVDNFRTMVKDVYDDKNSNGKADDDDFYGYVTAGNGCLALAYFYGFNQKLVQITADNEVEMVLNCEKAADITDKLIECMRSGKYRYLRVNFPNGDMVGHTGNLEATICSMEALDLQLARILAVVDELHGAAIITADHGNADEMTLASKEIDKWLRGNALKGGNDK